MGPGRVSANMFARFHFFEDFRHLWQNVNTFKPIWYIGYIMIFNNFGIFETLIFLNNDKNDIHSCYGAVGSLRKTYFGVLDANKYEWGKELSAYYVPDSGLSTHVSRCNPSHPGR